MAYLLSLTTLGAFSYFYNSKKIKKVENDKKNEEVEVENDKKKMK